jgi:sugar/nucleoside kinase (ribokinase family)
MSSAFLSVGHVARDEFGASWRLGGSAFYGAVTAARLGRATALITRVGDRERPEVERICREAGVSLHRLPSAATTTFAFRFVDGKRYLRLLARAKPIGEADVPLSEAPVLLGSIIGEHEDALFQRVAGRAGLVAQGELRSFDVRGEVQRAPFRRADLVLPTLRFLVLSDEDVVDAERAAREWSNRAPVVLTHAERGASVYRDGGELRVAAFKADRVVDPTGAGDAFAAALLIGLDEDMPWEHAMTFASAVASFCVEGEGVSGLADRSRVEARMRSGERLPVDAASAG